MEKKVDNRVRIVAGLKTTAAVEAWPFPMGGVRIQASAADKPTTKVTAQQKKDAVIKGLIAQWLED